MTNDKRTETHACDLISRQAAIDVLAKFVPYAICDESTESYTNGLTDAYNLILQLPSAQTEIIRCKDCKHNPKYEWFGCPMSHLSEAQRPETAWCWKAERRTDE